MVKLNLEILHCLHCFLIDEQILTKKSQEKAEYMYMYSSLHNENFFSKT